MPLQTELYDPETAERHLRSTSFVERWKELDSKRAREREQDEKCSVILGALRLLGTGLKAGVILIPCDDLKDNEFVVCRDLYERLKKEL